MNPGVLTLILFGDSKVGLFPPPGSQFMITEDNDYMLLEDGVTRMITE